MKMVANETELRNALKERAPEITIVTSYGQYILGKPANGLGNRAIYQPAAS